MVRDHRVNSRIKRQARFPGMAKDSTNYPVKNLHSLPPTNSQIQATATAAIISATNVMKNGVAAMIRHFAIQSPSISNSTLGFNRS